MQGQEEPESSGDQASSSLRPRRGARGLKRLGGKLDDGAAGRFYDIHASTTGEDRVRGGTGSDVVSFTRRKRRLNANCGVCDPGKDGIARSLVRAASSPHPCVSVTRRGKSRRELEDASWDTQAAQSAVPWVIFGRHHQPVHGKRSCPFISNSRNHLCLATRAGPKDRTLTA